MTAFHAPISEQIWDSKYRLKKADSTPIDVDVNSTFSRVAWALTEPEKEREHWSQEFYNTMQDFKFLPAGRIIAGAGTGRDVTLFNCFVMGTIPDSMGGIFEMLREAALTMQQGGGIGYDFSTIRPKGAPVKGVSADASGPLTFMDVWDSMCRTVMSAGSRRGAMMATMRCDHPDILDFIRAKKDSARLRMFNLSVLVTDEFMEAVEDGAEWPLIFESSCYDVISARDLWDAIMRATYDAAEPGVIFIDRINQQNNLHYCETISATNPCGEQPLPPYGACLLGSINLAALIENPYLANAKISLDLEQTVKTAVRMLDNVNDISNFPLDAQRSEAECKRRIGLGVTGLADALLMMGIKYGSEGAVTATESCMQAIQQAAYEASVELAREKGSFPMLADEYWESEHIQTLPTYLQDSIDAHGIRNSHLTSIAPTGTISLLAGNVSSGIEPIFAPEYTRKVLEKDGSKREEVVMDYAVKIWRDMGNEGFPPAMVTAQDLPPEAHVKMQAACQKYVDSSISKTINLPKDISFEDFKGVYQMAYDMGCKGCTTYRPNDITGSVLSVEESEPHTEEVQSLIDVALTPELTERPETLTGTTYKLKWPSDAHAYYVTINDNPDGKPFEIFIQTKNTEHHAWTVALTRMISAVFRRGGDVSFVAEELKEVFDPRGGEWLNKKVVPSVLAAIGGIIERHMHRSEPDSKEPVAYDPHKQPRSPACPECGSTNTQSGTGCMTCMDCGYSKCG
jgi:ribonucleoside-diphosphate reductase alpha chain